MLTCLFHLGYLAYNNQSRQTGHDIPNVKKLRMVTYDAESVRLEERMQVDMC